VSHYGPYLRPDFPAQAPQPGLFYPPYVTAMLLSITTIGLYSGRGAINTEQLPTPPPDLAGSFDLVVFGLNGRRPDLSVSITGFPVLAFRRFALGRYGGANQISVRRRAPDRTGIPTFGESDPAVNRRSKGPPGQ